MAMHIHSLKIIARLSIIVLITFISSVHGRIIRINSSDDHLITDGIDHVDDQSLALTTNDVLVSASTCQHTYGFLPCAENAGGYIFQILLYQGIVVVAEKQLSIGSKVFFKIVEKKFSSSKYVGIIFRILMELPAMTMMIVSGVFCSKESARSQVSLGVGIYAGITVFTLTIQWGVCLIYGGKYLGGEKSKSEDSGCCWRVKEKFKELKDTGVILQKDTSRLAGIMLLSLVPYIIVQLIYIFSSSNIVHLIACIVSAASLLSYFIYQIWSPWMQLLSSDYLQFEFVAKVLLKHVARERGKVVDDNGELNRKLIDNVFDEIDENKDGFISTKELEKLFKKIMPEMSDRDILLAVNKSFENFDFDDDNQINKHEFTKACELLSKDADFFSRGFYDEIFQQIYLIGKNDTLGIHPIMSKILMYAQTELLGGQPLIREDGSADIERIKLLFAKFDNDNNGKISKHELEGIIGEVDFGNFGQNHEHLLNTFFYHFDIDHDETIGEKEFVHGLQKWLREAVNVAQHPDKTKSVDEFDKIVWDKVTHHRRALLNFVFCIFRIVLGIAIMIFIGGPLKNSILQLSYATSLPSFSISFVIVPLAMNTRILIEAIFPVSKKTERTASLTFSEIYSSVVMNNISGLTTLLAIVYARDLPWDYSAEVLTILVVCTVIGILGSSSTNYPFWTCLLAFFLYPFSWVLYLYVELVLHWN